MKKVVLLIILTLLFTMSPTVIAQEETEDPTPTPTEEASEDDAIEQIQRIKDIVASKVAELNLVEKRGIIGTVTQVSNTEVTITDRYDESQDIDVDELTKFDFDDEDFGITDLEEQGQYSFIGLYNKDTGRLLARFISEPESIPVYVSGAVAAINEDEFQITVIDTEGTRTIVDIEQSTDTMSVDDEGALEESGFSDVILGEKVIIAGFRTDDETVSATRFLHFTNIPPSPELQAQLQGNTPDTTVATGSGNTLEIIESELE